MTDTEKQEIIDAVISQLLSDGRDITGLNSVESLDGISTFPAVLTTTTGGVTTKAIVSVPVSLLTQAVQDAVTNANSATSAARSAASGWAAAAVKMGSDIVVIEGDISNLQDADKSLSSLTAYAECSTAANVSAKAVTVQHFALPTSGGCLHIKMEHANTAVSGVTLNINATGAKDLYYNGSAVSATNTWEDNEILEIYYDGTNYQATNAKGGGGSADKISFDNTQSGLSAENVQGAIEEVNDKFNSTTELDLSKLSVSECRLAGNGTWVNAGDESHYWIPCNPNDSFRITAGDYNFSYGFLTQHSPTVNSSASPCSVYQGTLPVGEAESTFTVVAPSDAIGLAINKMVRTQQESESSDKGPTGIVKISTINDSIKSLENDIEAIKSEVSGEEVEVEPYSTKAYAKTIAGEIYANSGQYYNENYTLLWYPLRRGQTAHLVQQINTNANRSISYYNADTPNNTINNKLIWNHVVNNSNEIDVTYTAGEDGILCFMIVEGYDISHTLTVQSKTNDDSIGDGYNFTSIPKIGCGTQIVSRPTDTYCHAPMICESTNYRFICYHTGDTITAESLNNVTSVVLLVVNKKTGVPKYINVFDYKNPDTIDGGVCSVYYNQSIIVLGNTDTLMIRCGCQCNNKWMLIYKTYNATTDTLSSASKQQLSYNGNTYDLNLANYITMVNTLYSKSFTVVDKRATNEVTSMCYYNNNYYCVMGYFCHDKINIPQRYIQCPHVFAVSDDAITWQPIANITDAYYSSETLLTIVNGIVYHVFRSDRLGTFHMVFNLQGEVLKAPEPTNAPLSKVWSKPAIAYCGGRVLVGFNKPENSETGNNVGGRRSKMCLAEIAQSSPYGLTEYKTYISANGWNYYYFSPKKNGNLLVVNAEDSRCFNYESDGTHGAVTDVNICEIDMLEIIENTNNQ